jgi:hypothetical protein
MKQNWFAIILITIFCSNAALSQTSTKCSFNVCVSSTSSRKTGGSYFYWTLKVKTMGGLSQASIDSVFYYLPKTFSPNVVKRSKQATNPTYTFDLTQSGYGNFRVVVKVFLHNRAPVSIDYDLHLR